MKHIVLVALIGAALMSSEAEAATCAQWNASAGTQGRAQAEVWLNDNAALINAGTGFRTAGGGATLIQNINRHCAAYPGADLDAVANFYMLQLLTLGN